MTLRNKTKTVTSSLYPQRKLSFLVLTVITGVLILSPYRNFQGQLSQGDHGRDLYCFKMTMRGAAPYRDYTWPYGPFMPYYYSIFYHVFGVNIQSVLLGQNLLILLTGIFVFLICSIFLALPMSFICALWYWTFRGIEFFYTYNHSGGLLTIFMTIYFLLKYIHTSRLGYVYGGFISLFLLMLIRVNVGLVNLVAFLYCLYLTDFAKKNPRLLKNRYLYGRLCILVLSTLFLIYWYLLHGLSFDIIRQCFPYEVSRRQDNIPLFSGLSLFVRTVVFNVSATWPRKILSIIILIALAQCILLILGRKLSKELRTDMGLVLGSLGVFILLNLHEFIFSGTFYRLNWALPILIVMIFSLIDLGIYKTSSTLIRTLLLIILFLISFLHIVNQSLITQSMKIPQNLLTIGKNQVYVTNGQEWLQTVYKTTDFIGRNVPLHEKIVAIPYDPLYYFLTERHSAIRQFEFLDVNQILKNQQEDIMKNIEKENVNFIILSNRIVSHGRAPEILGITNYQLLAQYIDNNFQTVEVFGDWRNEGGWAWNHATKILKRKTYH